MNDWTHFRDVNSGVPQTIADTNYKNVQNVSINSGVPQTIAMSAIVCGIPEFILTFCTFL
jgi:hypothetical protein